MILGIIFVAFFNEFGNVNFQLVVIQPWKYTYLHGFTRDIVLCAFIDFWLLESRNADSETAGGPALLSINILEQRPAGASRASRPGTQYYGNRVMALAPGRSFSSSQSRFFGFQSQSLNSLAPRCPLGSTLQYFGHQIGSSFPWFWT